MPYCPIFAGTATECYWSNEDTEDGDRLRQSMPVLPKTSGSRCASWPNNSLRPRRPWADVAHWESLSHVASVKDLSQHALATLASSQADLIYLHLPAPHPPAFWDRRHAYLRRGRILSGLAGLFRSLARANTRCPRGAAALAGDNRDRPGRSLLAHQMWRTAPGWSEEDERISHGGRMGSAARAAHSHAAGQGHRKLWRLPRA